MAETTVTGKGNKMPRFKEEEGKSHDHRPANKKKQIFSYNFPLRKPQWNSFFFFHECLSSMTKFIFLFLPYHTEQKKFNFSIPFRFLGWFLPSVYPNKTRKFCIFSQPLPYYIWKKPNFALVGITLPTLIWQYDFCLYSCVFKRLLIAQLGQTKKQ